MLLPKSILSRKRLKSRRLVVRALLAIAVFAAAAASEAAERTTCRWSEHESRLTSYTARIRSLEKEISDMIESKHHLESSEKVKILTQQISFKHSDLAKVIRDYEAERLHVRFQHPDRDLEGDRQYSAQRLKSLEEIETSFGLDGRLDRIRRQVGIVFPTAASAEKKSLRKPASADLVPESEDDMPRGIKLVK